MGCDIHMVVQKQGDDGKWSDIGKIEYVETPTWKRVEVGVKVYDDRCYDVFSVLADVRNGTWGEPIPPIDQPRGLPDDCGYTEDDGTLGDHSFSWLTVAEILAYPWDTKIKHNATMGISTYQKWRKEGGTPAEYSQSVSGGMVTTLSMAQADALPDGAGDRNVYVRAQWETPVREHAKYFLEWIDTLAPHGEPDKIRLVFGFDS